MFLLLFGFFVLCVCVCVCFFIRYLSIYLIFVIISLYLYLLIRLLQEGNVLFNNVLNTFYFMVILHQTYITGPLSER